MNKTEDIKEFLLAGNTLTSMEAFKLFGSTRLSDVVFRLRKRGLNIVTREKTTKDRYGNNCTYCVYYIEK